MKKNTYFNGHQPLVKQAESLSMFFAIAFRAIVFYVTPRVAYFLRR